MTNAHYHNRLEKYTRINTNTWATMILNKITIYDYKFKYKLRPTNKIIDALSRKSSTKDDSGEVTQ